MKLSNILFDGKTYHLYHGSRHDFDSFVLPEKTSQRGRGIFFSNSTRYAAEFGNILYECRVSFDNPKEYNDSLEFTVDEMKAGNVDALYSLLKEQGYDGIVIKRSKVSTGIVLEAIKFDSNNIEILNKSTR